MKKNILNIVLVFCLAISACKGKKEKDVTTVDTTTSTAPVVIADDTDLKKGVQDATKDHPTVTATVNNGEVTLTGSIKRDKLTGLMQSIQSLHPKKVNNNLTVQP
jgi:osmotically-inducible protein OsmY